MGEKVPIREAAGRLGVSDDTIRRRLRRGELVGEQQPTPQGFTWLVELPEVEPSRRDTSTTPQAPTVPPWERDGEIRRLEEMVAILREELDARRREVQELHILLQRAQAALPPPQMTDTADVEGAAMQAAPAPPTHTPMHQSVWQAIWHRLRGH
jgi:hypothetical protein